MMYNMPNNIHSFILFCDAGFKFDFNRGGKKCDLKRKMETKVCITRNYIYGLNSLPLQLEKYGVTNTFIEMNSLRKAEGAALGNYDHIQ